MKVLGLGKSCSERLSEVMTNQTQFYYQASIVKYGTVWDGEGIEVVLRLCVKLEAG